MAYNMVVLSLALAGLPARRSVLSRGQMQCQYLSVVRPWAPSLFTFNFLMFSPYKIMLSPSFITYSSCLLLDRMLHCMVLPHGGFVDYIIFLQYIVTLVIVTSQTSVADF